MDNLEEKLGAILGNPQMMQQIMSMAQSFGQSPPSPEPEPIAPDIDPVMLTKIMSLANAGPDKNQQTLLHALRPYLTARRIEKLEKAMRAAKLAGAASVFLTGR